MSSGTELCHLGLCMMSSGTVNDVIWDCELCHLGL